MFANMKISDKMAHAFYFYDAIMTVINRYIENIVDGFIYKNLFM